MIRTAEDLLQELTALDESHRIEAKLARQIDHSVCVSIAPHDRAGLERFLRYCARQPFALERLRKAGRELIYYPLEVAGDTNLKLAQALRQATLVKFCSNS